jgi:3-oxoacyl-[acyl-carrier-protein] synthase-3
MAYINNIEYQFASKKILNEDLIINNTSWTSAKITDKIGIQTRYKATDDEFASDLAIIAAEKLFSYNAIDRKTIDFILYCTQSPDYFLPTTACIIQNKLSLSKNCGALDFNLGCSGFVYGLSIANALIESKTANNVLLITSETYSKFIHKDDISNQSIFSDAAAATIISKNGDAKINQFISGTDGSGFKNLIVKGGGIRYRNIPEFQSVSLQDLSSSNYLYMNGSEVFLFALTELPNLVTQTLLKNNLTFNDINLFIFHQASKVVLDSIQKKLNIDDDKFFRNLLNIGNTVSSTIPIAIKDALISNKIKEGDKVLIAGFGVGYSWSSTVLFF